MGDLSSMLQGRLDIKYLLKVAFEETNCEPFYYKKPLTPLNVATFQVVVYLLQA